MTTSIQLGNIFSDQDGTTRVSGGASGFDVESLVEGLTTVRRFPAVILEERIEENALLSDAYNELRNLSNTFQDAANFLRNPPGVSNDDENIFEYRIANNTSSTGGDASSFLTVSAEPGTSISEFEITVDQVAERNVKTTDSFFITDEDASVVGNGGPFNAGTLTLGPNNVEIELADGDSLNQVIGKINSFSDTSGVDANFIQVADGEYRITFRTTETGEDQNYDIFPPFTANANGEIAFEAENFVTSTASTAPGTFGVEFETIALAGASGGTAVTTPNLGQITNPDSDTALSAELTYNIEFANAGTYFLHTNLQAPINGSDTIHIGLDGVPILAANLSGNSRPTDAGTTNLAFSNRDIIGGGIVQFTIPPGDEGVHQFSLYLREDGTTIDKFVLTQDPNYVPTGLGPDETFANDNNSIFNIGFSVEQDAQDAQITIDGTQVTRSDNSFSDVIDGLTFNVLNTTEPGESLDVNIEADTELTKQGILNFVESYNAVRIFTAQQSELDDNGQPTEGSILAGDSTLRLITSRINQELSQQVQGLTDDFSRLSDLGITFSDFPGDDETPFTRNILTLNEEVLDSALATDFDEVRDIFEFNTTTDNPNLQVFERTNGLGVSDYTVNVDLVNEIYTATYDIGGVSTTVDFDAETLTDGTLVLNGQSNTELEGLVLLFSNPTDTSINVSSSQGIADRVFNTLNDLLEEGAGALDVAISSIADEEIRFTEDIARIDERVERFREQLILQFGALEAAISRSNTLLQSLDANASARNN